MRSFVVFSACILMISLSLWLSTTEQKDSQASTVTANSAAQPNLATPSVVEQSVETEIRPMPAMAPVKSFAGPQNLLRQQIFQQAAAQEPIAADRLASLPPDMQVEIQVLSGRDGRNNQIVEVSPGVFLNTGGPRVVPVATIDADGEVSIHEY